jgi:hypothetical protein
MPRPRHSPAASVTAGERRHRLPLAAEIALAFTAAAGTFALAAAALEGISSGVVVAILGVVYFFARSRDRPVTSIAYAVPVGMAGMLAYDWFYLPRRIRSSSRIPRTWRTLGYLFVGTTSPAG